MSRSFGGTRLTTRVADRDLALADLLEPGDHAQQRRLAAARRARPARRTRRRRCRCRRRGSRASQPKCLCTAAILRPAPSSLVSSRAGARRRCASACGRLRALARQDTSGRPVASPGARCSAPPCAAARLPRLDRVERRVRRQEHARMPRQRDARRGTGSTGSTSSASARQRAASSAREHGVDVDHGAARRVDQIAAAASCARAAGASTMPRVSSLSGTCSETTSLCANSAVEVARARRTPGKSPSMMYGSQAMTRANTLRADVRHALADAAEADDAERQVAGAADRARRQVVHLPGAARRGRSATMLRTSASAIASACVATSPTP